MKIAYLSGHAVDARLPYLSRCQAKALCVPHWARVSAGVSKRSRCRDFGIACRTWNAKLCQASDDLTAQILTPKFKHAVLELSPYFQESFGNATRLDYGTGHETTFIAFLYCLAALSKLTNLHSLPARIVALPQIEPHVSFSQLSRQEKCRQSHAIPILALVCSSWLIPVAKQAKANSSLYSQCLSQFGTVSERHEATYNHLGFCYRCHKKGRPHCYGDQSLHKVCGPHEEAANHLLVTFCLTLIDSMHGLKSSIDVACKDKIFQEAAALYECRGF